MKVPAANPSNVQRASRCCGDALISVRPMPRLMPRGDMTANSRRQPATTDRRSRPWHSLKERLKEMMLLWIISAKQISSTSFPSSCSPTAKPSNTECKDREKTRMKARRADWELKSTWKWPPSDSSNPWWRWWECWRPLLSFAWMLESTSRARRSSKCKDDWSLKARITCSRTRTRKKPMDTMNSGRGNWSCEERRRAQFKLVRTQTEEKPVCGVCVVSHRFLQGRWGRHHLFIVTEDRKFTCELLRAKPGWT